jgi:hypothetical protein
VRVLVGGTDPAEGVDPFVLTIDVELAGAPRLHRVAPLRAVECKDIPDLVGVLVDDQRKTYPPPPPAEAPPPTARPTPRAAPKPSAPPAPDRMPPTLGAMDFGVGPCAGPLALCGQYVSLAAGIGAEAPGAARVVVDGAVKLGDSAAILVQGDGTVGQTIAGYAGAAYRMPLTDKLTLEMRGLVGGGDAFLVSSSNGNGAKQCTPQSASGRSLGGTNTWFVAPVAAARARFGWFYVELGGTWRLNAQDTPAAFVDLGLELLGN